MNVLVYFNGKKVESTGSSKLVTVVMNTALWTCMCAVGFYGLVITFGDIALTWTQLCTLFTMILRLEIKRSA